MIKQDYLVKYVEQLAKVLAEIISLKNSGKSSMAIEIINSTLKDLKIDNSLELKNVPVEYYEIIADLLKEKGEIIGSKQLLTDAIEIYSQVNSITKSFSLDRTKKIESTQKLIDIYDNQ